MTPGEIAAQLTGVQLRALAFLAASRGDDIPANAIGYAVNGGFGGQHGGRLSEKGVTRAGGKAGGELLRLGLVARVSDGMYRINDEGADVAACIESEVARRRAA